MPFLPARFQGGELGSLGFVFAAEGRLDELGAILEEVEADLATGAGEGVEGVEVDGVGY